MGCHFRDARHGNLPDNCWNSCPSKVDSTTPWACQDWANTKAAYRFFGNDRISEANILAGHFASTRERFAARSSFPILFFTTRQSSLIVTRTSRRTFGQSRPSLRPVKATAVSHHLRYLMHSSLVTTCEGQPLGLAAIKFWSRDKFHGANALKRRINPTRVPLKRRRAYAGWKTCVSPLSCWGIRTMRSYRRSGKRHILIVLLALQLDTHFLVRTCVDRLAENGGLQFATK